MSFSVTQVLRVGMGIPSTSAAWVENGWSPEEKDIGGLDDEKLPMAPVLCCTPRAWAAG